MMMRLELTLDKGVAIDIDPQWRYCHWKNNFGPSQRIFQAQTQSVSAWDKLCAGLKVWASFHTLFNRMSLLPWQKALLHSLLKSCHKIESNFLLKFTKARDWMLSSRTSKALWIYGGVCVRPEIMSDLLENDGALSEVGSKELCTCNKGYMAGLKEMFSLGWAYWA